MMVLFTTGEQFVNRHKHTQSGYTLSLRACCCPWRELKHKRAKVCVCVCCCALVCVCMHVCMCLRFVSECVFVCKSLGGIKSHCLQLVHPPLLLSAAVRKSNTPLFPLSASVATCWCLIRSFMVKRSDDPVMGCVVQQLHHHLNSHK